MSVDGSFTRAANRKYKEIAMKTRMSIRVLAVVVLFPVLTGMKSRLFFSSVRPATEFIPTYQDDPQHHRTAAIDDTATGRVVRENEGSEIDIDASTCEGKDVVRFVSPYKKEILGTIECKDKATGQGRMYQKAQVTQKKEGPD